MRTSQRGDGKRREFWDSHHRLRETPLRVGELVLWRDCTLDETYGRKLDDRYSGPYVVRGGPHKNGYWLCELDGTAMDKPVAGDQLILFVVGKDMNGDEDRPVFREETQAGVAGESESAEGEATEEGGMRWKRRKGRRKRFRFDGRPGAIVSLKLVVGRARSPAAFGEGRGL
ncbi:hypothetical protein BC829DRAFT_367034 [Chytridium lagenaria]|nr:hypothetical protein BC829DRAFT_367034 [Chytridium lagenaria]